MRLSRRTFIKSVLGAAGAALVVGRFDQPIGEPIPADFARLIAEKRARAVNEYVWALERDLFLVPGDCRLRPIHGLAARLNERMS